MARTRKTASGAWKDYHRKAGLLLEASHVCLEFDLHDAGAMLAIHSAILIADSVLIRNAGVRSASENHEDIIGLLASNFKDAATPVRQLGTLLSAKNEVEYTGERIDEVRARDLYKRAQRFAAWCEDYLPGA